MRCHHFNPKRHPAVWPGPNLGLAVYMRGLLTFFKLRVFGVVGNIERKNSIRVNTFTNDFYKQVIEFVQLHSSKG